MNRIIQRRLAIKKEHVYFFELLAVVDLAVVILQ
jgi:hypothetical protein